MHTVFSAECTSLFDWFSLGVQESFWNVGMSGKLTRLLACDAVQLASYENVDIMPTFVHENHRQHPSGLDESASYNKPASVMHFSRSSLCVEDFVLFIDADMIFARRVEVHTWPLRRGLVVSERVPYMVNTTVPLARRFFADGRAERAPPVGWFHIFHRADLAAVAPRWLHFCGRVRTEPQRYWNVDGHGQDVPTGDLYVERGRPPWISEMHGYAFAAAEAGIDHVITENAVMYPSFVRDASDDAPYLLHYGLPFTFEGHDYDWHKGMLSEVDINDCSGPYIGAPPLNVLGSKREAAMRLVVNTLNDALYRYRKRRCSVVHRPLRTRPPLCVTEDCCGDSQHDCWKWALRGECVKNPVFMHSSCRASCHQCVFPVPPDELFYRTTTVIAVLACVLAGLIGICVCVFRREGRKEVASKDA